MITSRDNAVVREMRKLLNSAKTRRRSGRFAVEGARLCRDAALSGVTIEAVLTTADAREKYADWLAPVTACCDRVLELDGSAVSFLADTVSSQGVFCLCSGLPDTLDSSALRADGRYLLLEEVQDPANVGSAIRTAEALGLDGLLLTDGCCDLTNPKTLRASMGGVFRLPIAVLDGPADAAIAAWQAAGRRCFACVPDADATPVTALSFHEGGICCIGNEGSGLRQATIDACGQRLTIPMRGRAESLNAATAASLVMWEMMR